MDSEKRSVVLREIAAGRAKEAEIASVILSLPPEMKAPFGADQAVFAQALRTFQQYDPVVRNLELRLANTPGPYWKDLTEQETSSLATWSAAATQMAALIATHLPSQSSKDLGKIILAAIGIAALAVPFFMAGEIKPLVPLRFGPPALPEGIRATERTVVPRLNLERRASFMRPGFQPSFGAAARQGVVTSRPPAGRAPEGPSTPVPLRRAAPAPESRPAPGGHRFVFPKPGRG